MKCWRVKYEVCLWWGEFCQKVSPRGAKGLVPASAAWGRRQVLDRGHTELSMLLEPLWLKHVYTHCIRCTGISGSPCLQDSNQVGLLLVWKGRAKQNSGPDIFRQNCSQSYSILPASRRGFLPFDGWIQSSHFGKSSKIKESSS